MYSNLEAISTVVKSAFGPALSSDDFRFRARQRVLLVASILSLAAPYFFLNFFDEGISSGKITPLFVTVVFLFLPCFGGAILFGWSYWLAMKQKRKP
jgi:hypothetical protein